MKLDSEQKKVAKTLINVGRRMRVPRKDIISALITGITESDLRNLSYGDGTSVGWRQETKSSYPNVNRRNVKGGARRFYTELKSAPPGSVGERAQAVQRSAYPGRYQEHVGEARQILRQLGGKGAAPLRTAPRGPGGVQSVVTGAKTVGTSIPGAGLSKMQELEFIQNRDKPGAILEFVRAKKAAEAGTTIKTVVPTTKNIKEQGLKSGSKPVLPGRHVGKWERRYHVPAAHLGGTHLYGGAVDVGRKVAKMFGLTVTSTNQGEHVTGSYHYQDRAVDIAGTPAQMKKAFEYLVKNIPHGKLTELFYDPAGYYFDNGKRIKGAIGGHSDHVHLAI